MAQTHTHTMPLRDPKKKQEKTRVYTMALLNGNGYPTGRVRDKHRLFLFVTWAQPHKEFKLAFIQIPSELVVRWDGTTKTYYFYIFCVPSSAILMNFLCFLSPHLCMYARYAMS